MSTPKKPERCARASYRSQPQPAAAAESFPPAPGLPEESSFKTHTQCLDFLAEHTCSRRQATSVFGCLRACDELLLFYFWSCFSDPAMFPWPVPSARARGSERPLPISSLSSSRARLHRIPIQLKDK